MYFILVAFSFGDFVGIVCSDWCNFCGSQVEFLMKQFDMQVGAVLESLVVEDKYHGHVSSSCRYLARSYIKESKKGHKNKKGGTKVSQSRNSDNPEQQQQPKSKSLTETTRVGGSSSSLSAVGHKGRSSDDRFFDATEDLAESDDGSRSPLRRRSFNRAAVIFYDAEEGSEDMEREPPSFKREVGLLPGTTAASSSPADELLRSKSLQTFVKAQVIISSQESPEYANIDKEVFSLNLSNSWILYTLYCGHCLDICGYKELALCMT